MQQTKRHHYVPKAYLKAFCDSSGKLLVYRKDDPSEPLHVTPDATQFRRYYYSQPTSAGGRDNNSLESVFSTIESRWPETVGRLLRREDVNDRLESIFEFMSLQRVRVPASRDATEAVLAQSVKDAMKLMLRNGAIPPPPSGFEDLPNQIEITIDPHRSIHAMTSILQGMGQLYSRIGIAAVHNCTSRPFLTSDNPVLWFDPSLPFEEQRPYAVSPKVGPVLLVFPVSPTLVLVGSTEYRESFGRHGLQHSDVPDEAWVDQINAQVCRFAYEAVIAQASGQEELVALFAGASPVVEAVSIPVANGMATIHRSVFGQRVQKPKWRRD